MSTYKVVALFGPSSAGKDTLAKHLKEIDWDTGKFKLNNVVSCTTRPPRDYEENGKDYFFITEKQFLIRVLDGRMLEATCFRDWYYGTSMEQLEVNKINVGVFNIEGILNLMENPMIDVYPIYVECDDKTRLMRSLLREENPDCEEICRRFLADKEDFKWLYDENEEPPFEYKTAKSTAPRSLYYYILNTAKLDNEDRDIEDYD